MNEQQLREALVEYGVRLLKADLVQGTWGNLSARVDENTMLVTPSGMDYDTLTPEDIVLVDIRTLAYTGTVKPTSEKALHQMVYLSHPDAQAIIHTHADHCSVLAAALAPLPADAMPEELRALVGNADGVQVAAYGLPGSKKLAKNTALAMGAGNAALMAHHGAVCCGDSLETAYACAAALEEAVKAYIAMRQ